MEATVWNQVKHLYEVETLSIRQIAVLASGDPYCFGVGSLLARHVPPEETLCVPAPSSLSLACARLGWALDDVATISLCGRPDLAEPWCARCGRGG